MRTTPFEARILELCEELRACESVERQIELAREMRILIHERTEKLRGNLIPFPVIDAIMEKQRA